MLRNTPGGKTREERELTVIENVRDKEAVEEFEPTKKRSTDERKLETGGSTERWQSGSDK